MDKRKNFFKKTTDGSDKKHKLAESDVKVKIYSSVIAAAAALVLILTVTLSLCSAKNKASEKITASPATPDISDDISEEPTDSSDSSAFSITYDFNYTKETLDGEKLRSLLNFNPDGSYTANKEKCAEYVDHLADTYDTFGKDRKFHATIQGDIIVPNSSDAVYGWMTDREKTCEALVKMLEAGESVESCEPIYYDNGYGYVYTGVKSARTAEDDIGNTYIEIDLTAQHLWVYKNGEIAYQCDIVSGQSTSAATITLPGVYKLWYRGQNYPLNGSNADGESWSTTCNYWNLVSICGIGMHDTVSRLAYGGNIFQYDGSKGCINMPLESARYIYNEVELGTPVVMYYSEEQYRGFGVGD